MSRGQKKFITIITMAIFLLTLILQPIPTKVSANQQSLGGPIILMGIDAEDGGVGGHGPSSVYQNIVNSILAKVTNGGKGILVFGSNGPYVTEFWNTVSQGVGQPVNFVNDGDIETISLTGYAMIAISSDDTNTAGGLTQIQHDKLVQRQNDIAQFINNGGGLLGFASSFTNPYAYLGSIGNVTANINQSHSDITPNAKGQAIGITNDLDVCCWHDEYTSFPDFLDVLATFPTGQAAVIGGLEVAVPSKLTVSPSVVSIAKGQEIPLKVTLDDGLTKQDVTNISSGTTYSSNSPNILIDSSGVVSLTDAAQVGDTASITVDHNGYTAKVEVQVDEPVTILELSTVNQVTLGPGETLQLKVEATYSDGDVNDVTYASEGTTYTSSLSQYIQVSPNGMIVLTDDAPFGDKGTITVKNQDKTTTVQVQISEPPIALETNPTSATLNPGETLQLKVLAKFADGTIKDVTNNVKYTSQTTSLAIVNNSGLVNVPTSANTGNVVITATYAGLVSETQIYVGKNPPVLESIELESPIPTTLDQNGSRQIAAVKANWSDGTKTDVTSEATYESSVTARMTVTSTGLIEAVDGATGASYIYVRYGGKTLTSLVTLEKPPTLESIELESPIPSMLAQNGSHQISAVKANWSDGSQTDVTSEATYESTVTARMTVTSKGLIEALPGATGASYIYVRYGGKTLTSLVTLEEPPTLESIELESPILTALAQNGSQQISAVKANWSDGTQTDVTSEATYESSVPTRMTVTSTGLIEAVDGASGGGSYIYVRYGGEILTTLVTLEEPPTLESIELESSIPSTLAQNGSRQISAVKANWSDGTQTDVTSEATYESSVPTRMTVTSTGLIEAVDGAIGASYIYVRYGGETLTSLVTLEEPPTLESIELESPILTTLAQNGSRQISAVKANWSDGTQTDVTSEATYESSVPTRMTVTSTGLIEAVDGASGGGSYIYVRYGGEILTTLVTLEEPPTLESIELESSIPSTLAQNESQQISAVKANWSDGTQTDVTSEATYESSVSTRMTVSSTGLIEAVDGATGASYIYVRYGGKTLTSLVTLEEPPTLESIELESPIPSTLAQDGSHQISVVKANWSDGTQTDVTSEATYESSVSTRMTVSSTGLLEEVDGATGASYVYVRYGGKTLTTLVTLEEPPTLESIEIESPIPSTLAQNGSHQISAVKANWSDGTQTDVTSEATYKSSVSTRMTVSSTGLIEAVDGASGSSYIYVRYEREVITTLVTLGN